MRSLVQFCRRASRFAVISGIIVASACASAETGDRETFRCNAANGQFDARAFPISSNTSSVIGKILVHSADTGPKWESVAHIYVHQHDANCSDGDCGCTGVAIYSHKNPDHVDFYMTANGENELVGRSSYEAPSSTIRSKYRVLGSTDFGLFKLPS